MKKTKAIIMILFLVTFSLFSSSGEYSYDGKLPLTGYIYSNVTFSVQILNEAIPFNLANPVLADDSLTPTYINGLRIADFSLTSTSSSFRLYITHDKLHLIERTYGVDDKTLSSIDYRLFMDLGPNGFMCCLSDANPDIDVNDGGSFSLFVNYILVSGFAASLEDQGFYVSLYDHTESTTAETVEALMAGTYSSNIYFYLEAGE